MKDTGLDSIRINGKRLDELPFGVAEHANEGLPGFLKTDKENKANAIRSQYPRITVEQVDGRVRECHETIDRVSKLKGQQATMISEYSGHISLCQHRDREIAKLHTERDADAIKSLKRQFPPYDVEAMQRQIVQCNEAIERVDTVIAKEHASIAELHKARGLAEKRDAELKQLGA